MNVAMAVGLTFAAIYGGYLFVLWYSSATVIDDHEDRIAGLEKWRAEQFGGPGEVATLEPQTDEFPAVPATEPDGIAIQVQSALLRPSPVPRGKSAEWVEAEIEAMRARNAERMARAITEEAS